MTAPALPGAAPDPARLPTVTWDEKHGALCVRFVPPGTHAMRTYIAHNNPFVAVDYGAGGVIHSVEVLMPSTAMRAATAGSGAASDVASGSARALGGDGEPVACPECAARKPDDGDWWARLVLKAKSLAAIKSIAEGWPMSRPDVADEKGGDCG